MKQSILSVVLLVNIVCGASDTTEAPFARRVPPRITQIKSQPKKKYPLWLKIGIGVAAVTTTAVIGGLIWNKYRCNFEFDGPYSYCFATAMNIGAVLGTLGMANDRFRNFALTTKLWYPSLLSLGISNAIYCVHYSPNKKVFYRLFKSAFYGGLMTHDGVPPTAN